MFYIMTKYITQALKQTWTDISTRWPILVLGFWIAGLITLLLTLAELHSWLSSSACRPDGTFSPYVVGFSYWDISGFFQINVGFGNFTFTQAKIIDTAWDVVRSETISTL